MIVRLMQVVWCFSVLFLVAIFSLAFFSENRESIYIIPFTAWLPLLGFVASYIATGTWKLPRQKQ